MRRALFFLTLFLSVAIFGQLPVSNAVKANEVEVTEHIEEESTIINEVTDENIETPDPVATEPSERKSKIAELFDSIRSRRKNTGGSQKETNSWNILIGLEMTIEQMLKHVWKVIPNYRRFFVMKHC